MHARPVRGAAEPQQHKPWHAREAAATVQELGSDRDRGLAESAARRRRDEHGPNELARAPGVSWWRRLTRQFTEPVILVLLAAAVIAGVAGNFIDCAVILAIVVVNGGIGFFQEQRAERALAALRKLAQPQAKVIRDGQLRVVPARELVPGDLVKVEGGDQIPCDARLLEAVAFRTQEAALTGESTPVTKDADAVLDPATELGDRNNMMYMGTTAAAGQASALVVATAMGTELGRIAGMLREQAPEPTPLQRRLGELGRKLVIVVVALVAIIFTLHLLRGRELLEVLLISVSLAVAAIPEGLPAVITIALALGLQRMARRNALIRRLPSVETLGSVTVICSDKTGTLTRNEMTVQEIQCAGRRYQLEGTGYEPRGRFLPVADAHRDGKEGEETDPKAEADLWQALLVAAWCTHARLTGPGESGQAWQVIGDPTEGALVVAALKAGIEEANQEHHLLDEIPFDPERKAMSVAVEAEQGRPVMYSKGAPEVILGMCAAERRDGREEPLTEQRREQILGANREMASRALRVLGLAYRQFPTDRRKGLEEKDLVFAGLAGMIDPPREEAREGVAKCQRAGIRPVMMTGDHPETALAIARDLKIAAEQDRVMTGRELDGFSDQQLTEQVSQLTVYARVSAEHKLRVIRAWKAHQQVVAMTGDGINDAPAVKEADIGIAMGISGTDVTREAADMVLTDDNFASIVNAIEEGRGIFDNIRKFVHYLLSCNAGEVCFMLVAALIGWPAPLLALQILWINLVTDALPALALGVEPPEPDIMSRPPRPPHEPVITWRRGALILTHGLLIAAATFAAFALVYRGGEQQMPRARTVAFCTIAFAQLLFSLACRSEKHALWRLGIFSNRWLWGALVLSSLLQVSVVMLPFARPIFQTTPLVAGDWLLVAALSLTPLLVIELWKFLAPRVRRAHGGDAVAGSEAARGH